jgi:hypothetical protein
LHFVGEKDQQFHFCCSRNHLAACFKLFNHENGGMIITNVLSYFGGSTTNQLKLLTLQHQEYEDPYFHLPVWPTPELVGDPLLGVL